MKDSTIALIIASVVTVLAGVPFYYGSGYAGHGIYSYDHGKSYSLRHGNSRYNHGENYAKGNHGENGHHGGLYQVLKFKEQLGLTEDQIKLFNNLKFEYEKRQIIFERDYKIVQMKIERELNLESLNENKIRKLANGIGKLKGKSIEEEIDAQLNIVLVLNSEQKKKIRQMHETPRGE